ncbi:hypothetical protein DNTS_027882 [Danionella cerebrum]|uniref:Uncharacterized protein n=1 Tax=Danionella cerebrum TaxID=2873325 RepID=A0A553RCL9_9TELE|nr:hypothetical protein DNTS_027882 [Danionella translucida]
MAQNAKENIYEEITETTENIYEAPFDTEPKYENHGALAEPIYSTLQTRENTGTNGTLQEEELKEEEEEKETPTSHDGEEKLESEVAAASLLNGDGQSPSTEEETEDPSDEKPSLVQDDLVMAFSLSEEMSPEPEEIVDYSLRSVESSAAEETAPVPDPNQPEISLFVKVNT